jgi:hypothetical protein
MNLRLKTALPPPAAKRDYETSLSTQANVRKAAGDHSLKQNKNTSCEVGGKFFNFAHEFRLWIQG